MQDVNFSDLARSIYDSFNERDFGQIMLFADQSVEWLDMTAGQSFRGAEGLKSLQEQWISEYPDARLEVTGLTCAGTRCAVQLTGWSHGIQLRFCHILEFANGKLARAEIYQAACTANHIYLHQASHPSHFAARVRLKIAAAEAGSTTHFVVQANSNVPNAAVLVASVLANCEQDFTTLQSFFGNIGVNNLPFHVTIQAGNNGGGHKGCDNTDIACDAFNGADTNLVSAILVAEVAEVLEANQGRGWDCGKSNGEALSRVLAAALYPAELNTFQANFSSADSWLRKNWPNWVDNTEDSDTNFVSFGCGTLFINWMQNQLGFSLNQIIQAAGGTLVQTLKALTGWTDGFSQFTALLTLKFMPNTPSGLNNDNPFPIGPAINGTLLRWQNGAVWVVFGLAKFQIPDVATQNRLFPGQRVHQLGQAILDGIDTVPVDGTILSEENGNVWILFGRAKFQIPDVATRNRLYPNVPVFALWTGALYLIGLIPVDNTYFREESSSIVYIVQQGRKLIAAGVGGSVRVLWNGALSQIPSWPSAIRGQVTDSNGIPLTAATVFVQPGFVQLSTDSTGNYSIGVAAPATYQVSASADGYVPSPVMNVPVLDGQVTATQNFQLVQTLSLVVTGKVTDKISGMPISGATVTLTQNSAVPGILTTHSLATGTYSITMNPGSYAGSYDISAVADGYNLIDDTIPFIQNGATISHDFSLNRVTPGNISGSVTDLAAGTPIAGASVYVGPITNSTLVANSDAMGNYVAQNVLSGDTYVTVGAAGYRPQTQAVTVMGGQTVVLNFQLVVYVPPPHRGPGEDQPASRRKQGTPTVP
jgi:Carboxypeptidase regulatory-like domain/SnoaL-like domain